MLFHWKAYKACFNCYIWYLTLPLVFCLFLLFPSNVLLFILCVTVFWSMIGVLIAFIFHSDLEHSHLIFLILLVIASKFFKSYVNYISQNTKFKQNLWFSLCDIRNLVCLYSPYPLPPSLSGLYDIIWD